MKLTLGSTDAEAGWSDDCGAEPSCFLIFQLVKAGNKIASSAKGSSHLGACQLQAAQHRWFL